MKIIQVGLHTLKLYASIKELPHKLGKKMDTFLMKESGIGSNIADVDDHLARLRDYISRDKKEEAMQELNNLRYGLFSGISGINHTSQAFACLIHSIDDKPIEDYSEENLVAIMESLPISNLELETYLNDIKKKLIPNAS